ncbi:MAG: GGDEF domain-containing protein [Proteobacteria bacterium]|jgi:diguanylate cyclase (GGDEF)-like protein|nr:GGDEF domain-containing protein [Pseudomonadota bacterium]
MESKQSRRPRQTTEMTLQLDLVAANELGRGLSDRQAAFVVIGGMDMGDSIPLREDGPTVIGRDPECDGIIRDDGISRRHVRVFRDESGAFVLEDLDSTNGVFVGGVRVSRYQLADGDKVLVGRRTILKFVLQDRLDVAFQQQMYESSVRDALTGAFNRKHFDERIAAELSYAKRHAMSVTLAMLDLDHFKNVNDSWGHQAGDQVLQSVGGALLRMLRQEDIFARYGGEEFAVIARGIGQVGGLALGERLRAEVERILIRTPQGERIPVTISVGVCTTPGGAEVAPAELVRQSDVNLYAAKAAGRNRVVATELQIG